VDARRCTEALDKKRISTGKKLRLTEATNTAHQKAAPVTLAENAAASVFLDNLNSMFVVWRTKTTKN